MAFGMGACGSTPGNETAPPTPTVEASSGPPSETSPPVAETGTPEGPNSPNVLAKAEATSPPTVNEVISVGAETFRVVEPVEYNTWGTVAGARAQVDSITSRVPDEANIQVVQSGDQWAVVVTTGEGYYLPADKDGNLITAPYFRPDWLSSDVSQYIFISDGLGDDVSRGAVQVNSHWRPVAIKDGKIVAVVDVKSDGTHEIRDNNGAVVPTEDPLAGAPEGTTDKINGKWIKVVVAENGETFEYTWNEDLQGFYRSVMKDREGIPVIDWPPDSDPGYANDIGHVRVYVSDKVPGAQSFGLLTHKGKTVDQWNQVDLTSRAVVVIFNRINGRNPSGKEAGALHRELQRGEHGIDFYIDEESSMQRWNISPNNGGKVFIAEWDSMDPATNPGVSEITNNPYGGQLRAQLIGVDKEGDLVGQIAINKDMGDLTEDEIQEIYLFFVANVLDRQDQSTVGYNNTLGNLVSFATRNATSWVEAVPSQ